VRGRSTRARADERTDRLQRLEEEKAKAEAERHKSFIGKRRIGERLYSLVHNLEPARVGKITGMLLDGMDDAELLHLLESPEDLQDKVREDMQVLDNAK